MVNNAIKTLKKRYGLSLQASKKYISAKYINIYHISVSFIKKHLKGTAIGGQLEQTKGKDQVRWNCPLQLQNQHASVKKAIFDKPMKAAAKSKVSKEPKAQAEKKNQAKKKARKLQVQIKLVQMLSQLQHKS